MNNTKSKAATWMGPSFLRPSWVSYTKRPSYSDHLFSSASGLPKKEANVFCFMGDYLLLGYVQEDMDAAAYHVKAMEKVSEILHSMLELGGRHLVSDAMLDSNAGKLLEPPRTSVLRINAVVEDYSNALTIAQELITKQDSRFLVQNSEALPDVIFVSSIGPTTVEPWLRSVIVSPGCAQAVLRGAPVFAAGVLAILDNVEDDRHVSVWTDLEGKCTNGLRKQYAGKRLFLGNGILKMARDDIFGSSVRPTGIAIEITELKWRMPSFDSLPGHLFYPQNLPSILAVEELDLHPGMTVLDMCAAPGGKTSHIGAKMRNQGFLLAIDKSRKKVDALNRTLSSLRITCARTIVDDSARLCSFEISGDCPPENYEPGRLLKHGTFDRILLDPPCSGFGKRPLIVTDNFAPNLRGFAEYQKRLIRVASILLKSGGILVYSTCTMSLEENEGVIGYAIRSLPLKLEAVKNHKHGSEGVNFGGLTQEECYLTRRFWPAGPDDSVAFFYAKLRKI